MYTEHNRAGCRLFFLVLSFFY